MNEDQIKSRLADIANGLIEKGYERPEPSLWVYHDKEFQLIVDAKVSDPEISNLWDLIEADSASEALDMADAHLSELKCVDDHKKSDAVEKFGRAIDALRASGIEADFVDPLSEALKAMSENLLTDQRGVAA